jgi:hypothetical protein
MGQLTGKIVLIRGHLCVEATLYNLIAEPKALLGRFVGLHVGDEQDYRAVCGGSGGLLGTVVTSTGLVPGGGRKWYFDDWSAVAIRTDGQPASTWEEPVTPPRPRAGVEVKWTPTTATYSAPGWYKMLKRGWVRC